MGLINVGGFVLKGGKRSNWKLDCDALSDSDIHAAAWLLFKLVGHFSSVKSIPRGGDRLAAALRNHVAAKGPHLIVDDVLTTGGSMELARRRYLAEQEVPALVPVVGAVLFARGRCPEWVRPLFQLPPELWSRVAE